MLAGRGVLVKTNWLWLTATLYGVLSLGEPRFMEALQHAGGAE
jgi:hypothetical protein